MTVSDEGYACWGIEGKESLGKSVYVGEHGKWNAYQSKKVDRNNTLGSSHFCHNLTVRAEISRDVRSAMCKKITTFLLF